VRQRIGTIAELQARGALKFAYRDGDGIAREGFAALFEGQVVAYENACRHVPITLDYGDGKFYTPDGHHFICQTHGATYEPLTGLCIAGPCPGAALKRLKVVAEGEAIWLVDQP